MIKNDITINIKNTSDNFKLNIFHPIIIHNFLQSIHLLTNNIKNFNKHYTINIEPNHKQINQLLNKSLILITTLNTHINYNKTTKIAKKTHKKKLTLKTTTLTLKYLNETKFNN